MANYADLETLVGFGAEADAALAKVVRAVMQANAWSVTGCATFKGGPTGYHLHVPYPRGILSAIVTTEIDARVDSASLGEGVAMIKLQAGDGPDVKDGGEYTVYNPYAVAIPVGKAITVAPYGPAYILVGSDCVTP